MTKPKQEPVDFDGAWKHATRWLLRPMLKLILPELAIKVDWSIPAQFLEQELPRLRGFGRRGRRYVDRLIRLKLLSGKICDLLLHLEIQGRAQKKFSHRMLGYYLLLINEHGDDVELVQLAILCDLKSDWRPDGLNKSCYGTVLNYRYHVVKLIDYEPQLPQLIATGNPFALVIAAQIKASRNKRNMKGRARWKEEYLRLAKSLGRSDQEIGSVKAFIDHVFQVSPELDNEIKRRENELEKEGTMFHTGGIYGPIRVQAFAEGKVEGKVEGIAEGEARGKIEGMVMVLLELIKEKFGDVPERIVRMVNDAAPENLLKWTRNVMKRDRLEDVFS